MSEAARGGVDLVRLCGVRARLVPYDWAWARANANAVAANWRRRVSEKPGLFDGPVLLSRGCTIRAGDCEAAFFETRYSRFLALHDLGGSDANVRNAFAAIVPHTADGAVLLGEMAAHTANAGLIYFPCGTPDRDDVRADGSVDLGASAAREFREETGLSLPPGADAAPWVLARSGHLDAFLRPVRFASSADALIAWFEAHRTEEKVEPELARLVAVRDRAGIDPQRMPAYARAYLESVLPA